MVYLYRNKRCVKNTLIIQTYNSIIKSFIINQPLHCIVVKLFPVATYLYRKMTQNNKLTFNMLNRRRKIIILSFFKFYKRFVGVNLGCVIVIKNSLSFFQKLKLILRKLHVVNVCLYLIAMNTIYTRRGPFQKFESCNILVGKQLQ